MKKIAVATLLLVLAACAPAQNKPFANLDADPFEAQDPIKPFNHAMFSFNLAADRMVIHPIAQVYHVIPGWGRQTIGNVLTNLGEPASVVNGVLQLNPDIAFGSFWRFVLNSTVGFAGLRDFAGENGLKEKDANFSSTLGRYGVGTGAYVVLPIVGPSDARGTVGMAVDWFLDPVGWVLTTSESVAQAVVGGIATRDDDNAIINQLYYESIEPYSATRAAYLQHTAFQR